MPLVGTLSTMPLPDLLQWLGGSGRTGVLVIERNKVVKRIVLDSGRVIACASDEPRDRLGHVLVSRGKISEDTLRQALTLQEQAESPRHLGTILVAMGAISGDELVRTLSAQAEETIFGLFDLEEAVFRFEQGDVSGENISFPVDLRVQDILLRGMQRLDETRQIRTVFNDRGIVLKRTRRDPPREVSENRMARRIYDSINGERTVAEILLHAHASEYLVTRFLFELFRNGFVEITVTRAVPQVADVPEGPRSGSDADADSPPPTEDARGADADPAGFDGPGTGPVGTAVAPTPVVAERAPDTSLHDDLTVAGNLMSRGEYDAALEILNGTYREHPGDKALARLLAEAEACFLEKAYRHYLPESKIPVVRVSAERLASESISPEEYFLLSRIDGTWDIKSIIQISPIRQVDAIRALKRMRENGIIELRDPD